LGGRKGITHTHTFNGPFSGTTQLSRYQKVKTNLDFTKARDSERHWRQLGHMQVYTLIQTDNHASTPPLTFLQARCPSCRPTNSVKALMPFLTQEGHQACKKTEWWGAGVVICLEQGADLHMVHADATATHCLLLQ